MSVPCRASPAFQVAVEAKMAMDVEEYATSFRPDIIDAVSGWCQGGTFAKVLTLTDVFEVGGVSNLTLTDVFEVGGV